MASSESNQSSINYGILLAIILLEGFVTISVEILTIRQLIPLVGNSVIVMSLIIGVFLLFLAYGYRRGGLYQDNFTTILKNNFTKAAIWLGIGLSYYFIELLFLVVKNTITQDALISLFIYLFIYYLLLHL